MQLLPLVSSAPAKHYKEEANKTSGAEGNGETANITANYLKT